VVSQHDVRFSLRQRQVQQLLPLAGSVGQFGYFSHKIGQSGSGVQKRSSDISVTKSDSPDPVFKNGQITYMVNVSNNGPDTGTSVMLTDTLPGGVTFVSAISTQGICAEGGGTVTCDIGLP
jgi:uncharacterized repeat protein (TIGR01451 family)